LNLWLPAAVNVGLRRVRLEQMGVEPARIPEILDDVEVVSMNLLTRDPVTGYIGQDDKKSVAQGFAIPFFLVILMFMVVMVGAAPHLGAIAEDKMQRVFEMLLSSASPFELMMGKVVASLGTSLTSSLFYITGGLLVLIGAYRNGAVRSGPTESSTLVLRLSNSGSSDALGLQRGARLGVQHPSRCATTGYSSDPAHHPPDLCAEPRDAATERRLGHDLILHTAVHSRADAAPTGSARRDSLVAALAGAVWCDSMRDCSDLVSRPHFPHWYPFAGEDAQARGVSTMGVARLSHAAN
jgi:hypothetical protein